MMTVKCLSPTEMTDEIREKHYNFMLSDPELIKAFTLNPSETKEVKNFTRFEMYMEADHELVGLAWGLIFVFGDHIGFDMRSFGIKKEYRGVGVGTAFIEKIKSFDYQSSRIKKEYYQGETKIREIKLSSDTEQASSFWKKRGFRPAPASLRVLDQISQLFWWTDLDVNKTSIFEWAKEWAKPEKRGEIEAYIKHIKSLAK